MESQEKLVRVLEMAVRGCARPPCWPGPVGGCTCHLLPQGQEEGMKMLKGNKAKKVKQRKSDGARRTGRPAWRTKEGPSLEQPLGE